MVVTLGEIAAFRVRISEMTRADEADCAERLLGQIAALEAHAEGRAPDHEIEFRPHPTCVDLAERAMAALHAPPFKAARRRRFRRPSHTD